MTRTFSPLVACLLALATLAGTANAQDFASPWIHHLPYHLQYFETLRNLSATDDNLHFDFLSIDERTGEVIMDEVCDRSHTGTLWQLEQVRRTRNHRAWVIRNRSDSMYQNYFLSVDSASGQVYLSSDESQEAVWEVRYAGKFRGYDAYYLQTMVHSEAGFDFHYLGLEPNTNRVILVNDPEDSVHWLKRPAPDLPSEDIR